MQRRTFIKSAAAAAAYAAGQAVVAAPGARAGICDVLAHPNGLVYFSNYFETMGAVDPSSGRVERFRAGADSTGHGLGLPIVAWIAEAHGGTITVEDGPSGGTVATLALPGA